MPWKVSADPVDFEEAIAWFAKRVVLSRAEVDKLEARAKDKAFWVSHVAQLDLVHHAWKAIDKALAKGTSLEEFKKDVGAALRAAWSGSVKDPAWRIETIYRNGVQRAYSAGRYRQATTPEVLEDRPVWMFDAILDGRETEICAACDETKLPADHAWWKTHQPPLHHNCFPARTMVTTIRGLVPISEVAVGDAVLTHRGRWRRVTTTFRSPSPDRLIQLRLTSGRTIAGTSEHPTLTDRGWVPLASLRKGDRVLDVSVTTAFDGVVGDDHRKNTGGSNGAKSLKADTLRTLRQFDSKTLARQEEVQEKQILTDGQRVLVDELVVVRREPVGEGLLDRAGCLELVGVSTGVLKMTGLPGCHSPGDDVIGGQPPTLAKLGGVPGEPRMSLLGVTLGPMLAPCGALEGRTAKHYADGCAPSRIAYPLVRDRVGSSSDRNAVGLQHAPKCGHRAEPEFGEDLAEGHPTIDIELAEFSSKVGVLLGEPLLDGDVRHHLNVRLAHVESTADVTSTCDEVFNLAVEDDESYVADGVVVHNCRSSFIALTKEEAGKLSKPPKVEAQEGFGAAPTDDGDGWRPDMDKYPAELRDAFEGKTK